MIRLGFVGLASASLLVSACTLTRLQPPPPPPDFFTQVTPGGGTRYAHNWENRPCFSIEFATTDWVLKESTPDRVLWERKEDVLNLYMSDNRISGFAVSGMDAEEALRAFVSAELDYVKPSFDYQAVRAPRFARDHNGLWTQWSWKGVGGKLKRMGAKRPSDQQHVVASLWLDPWVLSFDWATTDVTPELGPTPAMIDVLESLQFHPNCFAGMSPGETWGRR